jgi:hypothetical protein
MQQTVFFWFVIFGAFLPSELYHVQADILPQGSQFQCSLQLIKLHLKLMKNGII